MNGNANQTCKYDSLGEWSFLFMHRTGTQNDSLVVVPMTSCKSLKTDHRMETLKDINPL